MTKRTASVRRRASRAVTALISAGALLAATLAMAGPVDAKEPPRPGALPSQVEGLAPYVGANSCARTVRNGTRALGELLVATWPRSSYAGQRTCTTSRSEHFDGRALDWMTSTRNRNERKRIATMLQWLLGRDADGVRFGNARRLGVMYLIWNNRIWSSYRASDGWRPYSSCASHPERSWDTTCHRDHVHISLSWEGARKRTSYWTRRVAAVDYGPCRPADLAWADRWTRRRATPCPWYAEPAAPRGSSALHRDLVAYSGLRITAGTSGPAVSVVQRALRVPATGTFDPTSRAAMRRYKKARGLGGNAAVEQDVWRSLLARTAP